MSSSKQGPPTTKGNGMSSRSNGPGSRRASSVPIGGKAKLKLEVVVPTPVRKRKHSVIAASNGRKSVAQTIQTAGALNARSVPDKNQVVDIRTKKKDKPSQFLDPISSPPQSPGGPSLGIAASRVASTPVHNARAALLTPESSSADVLPESPIEELHQIDEPALESDALEPRVIGRGLGKESTSELPTVPSEIEDQEPQKKRRRIQVQDSSLSPTRPSRPLDEPLLPVGTPINPERDQIDLPQQLEDEDLNSDFQLLDLQDFISYPWVKLDTKCVPGIPSGGRDTLPESSIYVPQGLSVLLQYMKHSLELETSARHKAEERLIEETQKRVKAEEKVLRLETENQTLKEEQRQWSTAVTDLFSSSVVSAAQAVVTQLATRAESPFILEEQAENSGDERTSQGGGTLATYGGENPKGKGRAPPSEDVSLMNSSASSEEVQRELTIESSPTTSEQLQQITNISCLLDQVINQSKTTAQKT